MAAALVIMMIMVSEEQRDRGRTAALACIMANVQNPSPKLFDQNSRMKIMMNEVLLLVCVMSHGDHTHHHHKKDDGKMNEKEVGRNGPSEAHALHVHTLQHDLFSRFLLTVNIFSFGP